MNDWMLQYEGAVRLGAFGGLLIACLLAEWLWPWRRAQRGRWPTNLGLVVIDSVVLRLAFPLLAVDVASRYEFGLLAQWNGPGWLEVVIAVVLLDLIIYWQHRLFHVVPLFWRLHRMHHSDVMLDATSALRFHPLEIVLSMLLKMAVVVLIGAPVAAVIIFEVLLNGAALFNHGNFRIPPRVGRILETAIITPRLHRIHHSRKRMEHNSNYGFTVVWWDRLFGSFTAATPSDLDIGLNEFRAADEQTLPALLMQPLR